MKSIELNPQRARFFLFVILSQTHIFLSYMALHLTHYQTHYLNSLMEYGEKYNPWIERVY